MGDVVAFQDRPLPVSRAMRRIRELWNSGDYGWAGHAEKRLIERGLSNLDVEYLVLESGHVTEFSKPGFHWRYRVEGTSVDGDPINAVFELEKEEMTVVTVFLVSRTR